MSPGNTFDLVFGNGTLKVFNSAGAQVFTQAGMPWTLATKGAVVWDIYQLSIYITFSSGAPQILSWDGVATWALANYAEQVIGSQKRTFFYRISPPNITMQPSATTGSVSLVFSAGMNLVAGHVGTRMRYIGRQLLITAVANPTHATATVEEILTESALIGFAAGSHAENFFNIGDVVIGQNSGARGIVAAVVPTGLTVQMLPNAAGFVVYFTASGEFIIGPSGGLQSGSLTGSIAPQAITDWDDEVMNSFRGYPAGVFVDQNRVGFCNFPAVPSGVGWSAIGNPTDLYVGAQPDNAIFELAPGKSRVLYVLAGAESSEFVFCDNGAYYIPITTTNPLVPGSVAFNLLSKDGSALVQPRLVQDVILWINAGLTSVLAIVATGAYNRPYEARNISELHAHLLSTPIAIAAPTTTAQFEERYVYVLNSAGTIAVGKYQTESGQIKGVVGWLPWNGVGTVNWLSAFGSDVLFSTSYAPNGIAAVSVIERLDNTQYLDAAMLVNAAPAAFAPPGGKGPLWWLAGGTVDLMDQATRMMGTYTIDADGNIIPQNNGGENLLAATLVAGQPWTAILEPFAPDATTPGQSVGQRLKKRRVSWFAVYVIQSTGFLMARLFSGPLTPTSPALGEVVNQRRFPAWNQGDDPTLPPPLREEVQRTRPLGRSFDPRVAIIKDTPGPLEISEIGLEVTV